GHRPRAPDHLRPHQGYARERAHPSFVPGVQGARGPHDPPRRLQEGLAGAGDRQPLRRSQAPRYGARAGGGRRRGRNGRLGVPDQDPLGRREHRAVSPRRAGLHVERGRPRARRRGRRVARRLHSRVVPRAGRPDRVPEQPDPVQAELASARSGAWCAPCPCPRSNVAAPAVIGGRGGWGRRDPYEERVMRLSPTICSPGSSGVWSHVPYSMALVRRHRRAIELALLALVAYLGALGVSTAVRGALETAPPETDEPDAVAPPALAPLAAYAVIA